MNTLSDITNDDLLLERPHALGSGVQRLYRFKGGRGLSVVNPPMLHSYPFAWEIAVIKGLDEIGDFENLDYSTDLTSDVEVFMTDEAANEFIAKAKAYFNI